ncbi:MAG TPA: beta-propeller domain-containing protein [Usitatibacter sp.]|nr:beta-propeller domain-containing protein [Usitatibacter sp.]
MSLRALAITLLVFFSSLVSAATIAERSPFAQGHWWDPGRPGSGFELFNVDRQAMVIWYTYESDGRPVWYTAQGELSAMAEQGLPLLKHRWAQGRYAGSTGVGTLRVEVNHPESVAVRWTVSGQSGATTIQPFVTSGVQNEVDHTGSWFDPANSGWGLTLTEQGDVLGGVVYTYDPSGAPTWIAGFGRDRDGVELFSFRGACPACDWQQATSTSAGRLGFSFASEYAMSLRNSLTLPMAEGVSIGDARLSQLSRPASSRPADRQLARFDSAASLEAFLEEGLMRMPAFYSPGDFSPAPPGAAFSTTNLVEAGVDEAGIVKSDGRFIYTYDHEGYQRKPAIRIAEVGPDGSSLAVRGTVPLPGATASYSLYNAGLYLAEQKLVSVASSQQVVAMSSPWFYPTAWVGGSTRVEMFSTATPGTLSPAWRIEIDGHLVASRRIDKRLHVVTRFAPLVPGFGYGRTDPASTAANRALLANTPLHALLPKVRVNGGAPEELLFHGNVSVPPLGGRPALASMVIVTVIDLATPHVVDARAIAGSTETLYVSAQNLYLATTRHETRNPITTAALAEPLGLVTDIHQLRLGGDGLSIVGSASVEGGLGTDADQVPFRMSEHEGRLRVVSSSHRWWMNNSNRVTVLEPSTIAPGLLRTVATLPNAQRPEPLGKPNEILYGTRFVGERLYAVTFQLTDPLYVVDLANPSDPRITGALVVPGFSEYLHPLPNGLLLGFGRDADSSGFPQGLQLSLYDVSDAGKPRELQKAVIGKRGSDSALLKHHHAFSVLPRSDGSLSIAIPARIHDGVPEYYGSQAMYPWQMSGLVRYELRGTTPADARLVQGSSLVSHSPSSGSSSFADPAMDGGRSILFGSGAVYIGHGRFWRQDAGGNTFGPF